MLRGWAIETMGVGGLIARAGWTSSDESLIITGTSLLKMGAGFWVASLLLVAQPHFNGGSLNENRKNG